MFLPLLCVAHHPQVPALAPADVITLFRHEGHVAMTVTPTILSRIADAIAAGALVLDPKTGPTFEEIAEAVEARSRLLDTRIETALVQTRREIALRVAS